MYKGIVLLSQFHLSVSVHFLQASRMNFDGKSLGRVHFCVFFCNTFGGTEHKDIALLFVACGKHMNSDKLCEDRKIAVVVGAGVSGLTSAIRLLEDGWAVKIAAEKFSPDTTSDGAQT